jgi:hypothetical protein
MQAVKHVRQKFFIHNHGAYLELTASSGIISSPFLDAVARKVLRYRSDQSLTAELANRRFVPFGAESRTFTV